MAAHILFVENDFDIKREAAMLLFSNGFEMMPVSNAAEAVGALRLLRTDLLVSDAHLPDHGVDHLIQTVRGSKSLHETPVLVLVDTDDKEERDRFLRMGADACIEKKAPPERWLETIRNLVASHRARQEEGSSGSISGQLARLTIVDLLRQLVKDKSSGVVVIDGSIVMEIHLVEGRIVHARHGITVGKKALFRCLRVAEAAFNFQIRDEEIEPTVEGEFDELLAEAKSCNERLMANYHNLPNANHRIRVLPSEALESAKLRAEARAALEIIKKHPRVAAYVDRLNLPDIVCYEYLLAFLDRGFVELATDKRPVRVFTDSACDLPPDWLIEHDVTVFPIQVQVGGQLFTGASGEEPAFYRFKPKRLEQAVLQPPEDARLLQPLLEGLPNYDCLALVNPFPGVFERVQQCADRIREEGVNGKNVLANELLALNSHAYSLGLGLLVQQAVKLAEEDCQIEVIEEKLLQAMARLHMIFAVEPDRSYLVKKGSGVALVYWDGSEERALVRLGKGESPVEAIVREARKRYDPKAPLQAAVGHVRAPETAKTLQAELASNLGGAQIPVWPIGLIAGARLGEGAVGMAFFQ